jgi:hypothetical protein
VCSPSFPSELNPEWLKQMEAQVPKGIARLSYHPYYSVLKF